MPQPQGHTTYFGKKFQTQIITHTGFRRIVKFDIKTKNIVSDKKKLYKNHENPCFWCDD